MLGVCYEDLVLDYELTLLSIWGERNENSELFKSFMEALRPYGLETDDIKTKAVQFLKDCNVSKEQMEKIKTILLEN